MFAARERRPRPARDDKVLASYTALMISGLSDAAGVVGPELHAAAERALRFVEGSLVVHEPGSPPRARLMRHVRNGVVKGPGFLDDHAFVGNAALDVYEFDGDPRWVPLARAVAEGILAHFFDGDAGFYFAPDDGEKVVVRARDAYDHAVPSGASMACKLLLRLGTLVDPRYGDIGARAVERMASAAAANPFGMSGTVALVDRLVRGSTDVVLVGPRASQATRALAREALRAYLPDRVLAWADPGDPRALEACAALAQDKPARSEPVAYVCRGRTCSRPLHTAAELADALSA